MLLRCHTLLLAPERTLKTLFKPESGGSPILPLLNLSDTGSRIYGGFESRIACAKLFGMATKRTKADKAQRQADQLDKKSERRPEQATRQREVRKDTSRAA
jgi:hypothetical protein